MSTADNEQKGPSALNDGSYLDITYSQERAPFGKYPLQLSQHVLSTFFRKPGRLLDVGCGRGEFMAAFKSLNCDVAGVDISPRAPELAPGLDVRVANLEVDPLPFEAGSFDFVFSKSVIEHVRDPLILAQKMALALKPGGTAVVMTPSWVHNAWGPFYIDHTHVTPFTAPSLDDVLTMAGLKVDRVDHFMQLPVTWKYPALYPALRAFALLPLPYRPMNKGAPWPDGFNKLIRFSKEVMLLAVARKP